MKKLDFIAAMRLEGEAYTSLEAVMKLIEGQDRSLKNVPLQPLYNCLKKASIEEIALALPMMSYEQRRATLDIDMWVKDEIDVSSFELWLSTYSICSDCLALHRPTRAR